MNNEPSRSGFAAWPFGRSRNAPTGPTAKPVAGLVAGTGAFVALLSGCAPSAPADSAMQTSRAYQVSSFQVYEFRLDDGTRCVATYNGGLACDWRK